MANFFYLKCLIYINVYQYASRTWVKSTDELMLMLDEASVDKGREILLEENKNWVYQKSDSTFAFRLKIIWLFASSN